MAFVPWKDRVTATPHRYTLTNVSGDTYDLTAVPGAISEAGIPVNAANLDKLIQRDGDDIKDTVTTFTEASTRANIATGEKTSTVFGKIKKFFTDLKTHAFTTPSTTLNEGTTSVPSDKLLYDTAGAISNPTMVVNGDFTRNDSGTASFTSPVAETINKWGFGLTGAGVTGSYTVATKTLKKDGTINIGGNFVFLYQYLDNPTRLNGKTVTLSIRAKSTTGNFLAQLWKTSGGSTTAPAVTANNNTLFKSASYTFPEDAFSAGDTLRILAQTYSETVLDYAKLEIGSLATAYTPEQNFLDTDSRQKISGVKEYTASPIVPTTPSGPSAAVSKSYADGLSTPYSKVIRNQTDFNALIGDPSGTWLGATSVALVGQFTLSTANNGIKIPDTVKQIHGFNGAKITVTNFAYNSSTAKGGLWYDTRPTTLDYSVRDLEVDCTGTGIEAGYGFVDCTNLTNCTGTGTGTGAGANGFGFYNCTNLTNCTGTGTGVNGFGFYNCTNLTNCIGTGTGTSGYGFYNITYASNCMNDGSSTNMWGGTNKNIDIDTCRKTPVDVTSGELTTLNT